MHIANGKGHPDVSQRGTDLDFRDLLEALPAAAYTCDATGQITYFNRRAAQAWGREPRLNDPAERYCGSWRLYTLEGGHVPHDQCWMAKCLHDRKEYLGAEIVVERPDGTRRIVEASATPFVDDQGQLTGAINVVVDITHRKHSEAVLREREQSLADELTAAARMQQVSTRLVHADDFSALLHEILDAAILITGADMGNIQLLEGGALRIVAQRGFDAPFLEFFGAVHLGEAAYGVTLRAGERLVVADVETSHVFVGTPALAVMLAANARAVQSTPLTNRSGRGLGMFSTHYRTPQRPTEAALLRLDMLARLAADLIERRQAEESLRAADRRKDEFLAVLAHELRNPLAPIHNSVAILRIASAQDPDLQRVVQMMDRQVNQMVRLLDDLMEVSRISRGKISLRRERVEIATFVRSAIDTSQPLIDAAGHHLEVLIPDDPLVVDGDPVRLAQIVSNLLNNAAKYTTAGGLIWLTVRQEGDFVVMSVRDTGVGISEEMLPRVFDLFVQADERSEAARTGLGIGLSLVKTLVSMHGGAVDVRSDGHGRGSEFVVRLPLVTTTAALGSATNTSASVVGLRPHRVLVVDDNCDSADTAGLLLKLLGADVRVVYDGAAALGAFATFNPSFVVMDIAMPLMDGYELARQMRECAGAQAVTLIALTGRGQAEDRHRSTAAGIDFHLIKPASLEDLKRVLSSAPIVQSP